MGPMTAFGWMDFSEPVPNYSSTKEERKKRIDLTLSDDDHHLSL
jgi:hypothetical protein